MDNASIEKIIHQLAKQVLETAGDELAIIGIRSGGEALANALRKDIEGLAKKTPLFGVLDITLYRDDLGDASSLKQPQIRATEVPFPIDGKRLILVDDVLFTGRTVRAALDALCDLGRPAKIDLLVLVDRNFRELPIRADYVGTTLETKRSDQVNVAYDKDNGWSIEVSST